MKKGASHISTYGLYDAKLTRKPHYICDMKIEMPKGMKSNRKSGGPNKFKKSY